MTNSQEPPDDKAQQKAEPTSVDKAAKNEPSGRRNKKILVAIIGLGLSAVLIMVTLTAFKGEKVEDAASPTTTVEQTVQEAETFIANGKYDEAVAEWNKLLESSEGPEQQIQAHLGIALVYMNKQDYPAALEHYRKAEQLATNPTSRIIDGIITVARLTNNKALELEYIPKAIELLNPNDPLYEEGKENYQQRIQELNAQPN